MPTLDITEAGIWNLKCTQYNLSIDRELNVDFVQTRVDVKMKCWTIFQKRNKKCEFWFWCIQLNQKIKYKIKEKSTKKICIWIVFLMSHIKVVCVLLSHSFASELYSWFFEHRFYEFLHLTRVLIITRM